MEIEVFVFAIEVFQFPKLHEGGAKYNKLNFLTEV